MSIHARHNVDEVELLAIKHFLGRPICRGGEHLGAVQPRISRSHNCNLGNPPPGFNVTLGEEATPDDFASILGQGAHAMTFFPDSLLAAHPANAARAAATATALIGIAKLAVCRVTRPTAHMASAPASEPQPLSIPIAVDT